MAVDAIRQAASTGQDRNIGACIGPLPAYHNGQVELSWLVGLAAAAGLAAGAGARAAASRYLPAGRRLPPGAAEAGTAALFALLAAAVRPPLALAAMCWLAACAVALAVIDEATRRLPDPLTAAAYAGVMVLLLGAAADQGSWGRLGRAAAGGAVLAGCFLLLALARPGAVGFGDVKLAASTGSALAWFGWGALLDGAAAGLILAAAWGLALLALRRATLRQQIPYGPFLLAGALAVIVAAAATAR
ncbi:MAG: prepilin peptidase [Streptosporangiaceae bacterium]